MSSEGWFVAQLRPNGLQLAQSHLARQGYRTFAPWRQETVRRAGRLVARRTPLFPGYVFVQFDAGAPGWGAIDSTRGVARLIRSGSQRPAGMPPPLMAGLLARCDGDDHLQLEPELARGDQVRIVSGPFASLVATIEDMTRDDRLRLLADLMGRATAVTVPASAVERID